MCIYIYVYINTWLFYITNKNATAETHRFGFLVSTQICWAFHLNGTVFLPDFNFFLDFPSVLLLRKLLGEGGYRCVFCMNMECGLQTEILQYIPQCLYILLH